MATAGGTPSATLAGVFSLGFSLLLLPKLLRSFSNEERALSSRLPLPRNRPSLRPPDFGGSVSTPGPFGCASGGVTGADAAEGGADELDAEG